MDNEERAALRALPKVVMIYRGCYELNRDGLCWTLNEEVARRFPTQNRYLGDGAALLLTAEVDRGDIIAVKLDRGEQEVIAYQPRIVAETVIDIQVTPDSTH